MRFAISAVLAASLAASAAAAAEPSTAWEPAGKWEVNFADQQCLAFRPYKRGDETVQIALEAIPPGYAGLGLYVIVPASSTSRWHNAVVEVGGRSTQWGELNPFSLGDDKLRAFTSAFTNSELARLEAGESLGIGAQGRLMQAKVASLPVVRKHLATCVGDLMKTWGYPIEQQQQIASFPTPVGGNPARLFGVVDYPTGALRKGADGRVRALIRVGTDGRGKGCRIVLSSRNAELDARTCEILMQRARYVPGTDKSGQLVEAPYLATINWVVPG